MKSKLGTALGMAIARRFSSPSFCNWLGIFTVVLGLTVLIGGVVYLGLYLCLLMGIVNVIEGIKASPVDAFRIGFGIVRVLITTVVCSASLWIGIIIVVMSKIFFDEAALLRKRLRR